MVAETSSRGSNSFPEISIHLGIAAGPKQIVLPPAVQIAATSVLIAAAAALCYLGVSRIGYDRVVADMEAAVVRAETANADLQDEVASLRDRLVAAVRDRKESEARLSALTGEADTLRVLLTTAEAKLRSLNDVRGHPSQQHGEVLQQVTTSKETATSESSRIGQLTLALDQAQRELRQVQAQRATIVVRLKKVEADRAEQQVRSGQYKATLEAAAKKLQQLSAERDKAVSERDRLRARSSDLEQKHTQREAPSLHQPVVGAQLVGFITLENAQSEAEQPRTDLVITDAPPEPKSETGGVAELAHRAISEFERAFASTGLDIRRLFPQFGLNRAEGGPFVLPPKGNQSGAINPDQLDAMRSLIKSLPLSTPLDYYQLESRFGPRRDPFNRRLSFHTGLDLSAPYMSPIYATAPGIVTYAGYRSDYGKVVEIDHGNGIATVYGHMHRYIVSVGQRVTEHTQIGFLGSTGRSSGPHVHYEVLVNGESQDPEKFIALAHILPVADR